MTKISQIKQVKKRISVRIIVAAKLMSKNFKKE